MCQWLAVSASVSVSLYIYMYLVTSCAEDKSFLPCPNFKALLLKVEPINSTCAFPPPPSFYFFFQQRLALQSLARVSVLCPSEVAQKEIQAATPPLGPFLQTPAENPVKSYTTLKRTVSINTAYISIYPARENYVP